MANWLRTLMPKEEKFFPLFDAHAELLAKGAQELRKLLQSPDGDGNALDQVAADGERTARDILGRLRGSFVTPFDRTDIKELTATMQAALNDMAAVGRTRRLPVQDGGAEALGAMGDQIVEGAGQLRDGVKLLEKVDRHADELRQMRERVGDVRARVVGKRDEALLNLFGQQGQDPLATLGALTFLERVGAVADRLDAAADRIDDLVLDHV
jgi:uncharacterized protein